ncbi:phage tail protein [Thiolapillus sp.]|uniref:phage tail protein n=1 Tax=Thiolapillus sp. TaxID=2017437 RepID=UPI003AF62EB6
MIIDRFVAILGLDVKKGEFERGQQAVSRLKTGLKSLAAVAAAAFATFGAIGTARDVARLDAYAKAVGISTDFLEHLGHSVAALGFDYEHVADMVEEMNNKIGESIGIAEMTPVKEALGILGLEFEKLSKMDRELQFRTVMNAAMELDDSQAASAAVDILVGSESSKITSYLRSSGKSFDELMQGYADGDAQTKQTREGLIKLGQSVGKIGIMFGNLKRALLGFFAVALEPMTRGFVRLLKSVTEFIHSGLENHIWKLVAGLKLLIATLGTLWLFSKRAFFIGMVGQLMRLGKLVIGGMLIGGLRSLPGLFMMGAASGGGFLAMLIAGIKKLGSAMLMLLRIPGVIAGLIAAVVMAAQDMWTYFTDPEAVTLTGKIVDAIKSKWSAFVGWWSGFWDSLTWTGAWDWVVAEAVATVNSLVSTWQTFRNWIFGLWDSFATPVWDWVTEETDQTIGTVMTHWGAFRNWIFGLWDSFATPVWRWIVAETDQVVADVTEKWDAFRDWIFGLWNSFTTPVWDWMTKETAAVIGQMEAVWEAFTSWIFAIWDSFEVPIWDWLIDSTAEAIDAIKSMWTDFTGWFSGIGDWMGKTSSAVMDKIDGAIGGVKSFFGADEEQGAPDITGVRAREIDVSGRSLLPPGLMPQSPTSYVTQSTSSAQTNNNTTTTNVDATINVDAGGMRAEELDRYVNEKLTETAGRSINLTGQPAW